MDAPLAFKASRWFGSISRILAKLETPKESTYPGSSSKIFS